MLRMLGMTRMLGMMRMPGIPGRMSVKRLWPRMFPTPTV